MIKELTELVSLTEVALPNAEDLLGFYSHNNRDVMRLYHAIHANNFRTEADAIQKANVGERTKFRQVARELLRCLEQMVLQIGFEKEAFDPLNNGRFRGFQLTAISKSLAIQSCKNASKKAAEELLKIGLEYARPEFVVEAAKALMNYVCVAGESMQEYETHRTMFETYAQWRLLEERAIIHLDWVSLFYANKKALQKENAVTALQYLEAMEPYVGEIPSHNFHMAYFLLDSMRHHIEANYRAAAVSNDRAIAFFSSRMYPCSGTLRIFYYHGIINCVYLAQYEKGEHYLELALDQVLVGNNHWFNTLEIGFYLKMHNADYLGAAVLYHKAVKHKRFNVLRDTQRETWHILGAYLHIVGQLANINLPENMAPKVKSSRFRNEIKDFSHDKTGMNIAILAAEVLLEFVEGKEDELWDRIAALEKYRERYLRNSEDTHRSQLFIKILVILSKYNYDGDKFLEKARPYLLELRTVPLQITNQAHELEIVPYERLVRLMAESLVKRKGRVVGHHFTQKLEGAVGAGW
jgi:NifU-like protein involved in Fe-S cluster formation